MGVYEPAAGDFRPYPPLAGFLLTGGMFVSQQVTLPLAFPFARARLIALAHDGSLRAVSGQAFTEGGTATLRVGPFGGVPGVSKLVRVQFAEPVPHHDRLVLPLRWEATGSAGRLFPMLDADFTLVPEAGAAGQTRLILAGSYRPPLEGLGAAVDRMLMHHIATATMACLLHKTVAELTRLGHAPAVPERV